MNFQRSNINKVLTNVSTKHFCSSGTLATETPQFKAFAMSAVEKQRLARQQQRKTIEIEAHKDEFAHGTRNKIEKAYEMNVPVSSADRQRLKKEVGEIVYNFEKDTVPIKSSTSNSKKDDNSSDANQKGQSKRKSSVLPSVGLLLLIGSGLWWKKEHIGEIAHADGDTSDNMNNTISSISKLPNVLYNICVDIYNGDTINESTSPCVLRSWIRFLMSVTQSKLEDIDSSTSAIGNMCSDNSGSVANSSADDKVMNTPEMEKSVNSPDEVVSHTSFPSRKNRDTLKKKYVHPENNPMLHQHHDSPMWLQRPRSGAEDLATTK